METAQLKKFAQESRNSLMSTVEAKLNFVLAPDSLARRESQSAVAALEGLISEIGREQVVEKVAYTWFNRFCALRFMDVNHYTKIGVVSAIEGQTQPEILAEAKSGYIDGNVVDPTKAQKINGLLDGSITSNNPQGEAYRILLAAYCNSFNKLMPFMFERINDYTELLMPDDLLAQNSVLSQTIEVLTPETCKDVEVIGWLYQYYISEKKDEVFAELKKGKKISKENVPAATQIFTPKWIVSYMVENSVGKLWLESHPDSKLQSQFKYYLESAEQEEDVKAKLEELKNKDLKPQDIKVLDPACGSGHILVTAFDILFEIYKSVGYQENEIPELILKHNLYGLDICDRAAQLSQFAVMMKAREYDRNIFNKVHDLNICSIKDTDWIDIWVENELLQNAIDKNYAKTQIYLLKDTFKNAKEYGSIIEVKDIDFDFWNKVLENIKNVLQQSTITPKIRGRLPYTLKQAKIMQEKYDCVITNPPYLGSGDFDSDLTDYLNKHYKNSNSDMCIVFIEKAIKYSKKYLSLITMQSWMTGKTNFEFRKNLINNIDIASMLHLGSRAFDSISGEIVQTTTFVMSKGKSNFKGTFYNLTQYKSEAAKEENFLIQKTKDDSFKCCNSDFSTNPDFQIVYDNISQKMLNISNSVPLKEIASCCTGMQTGNNDKYVRYWQEVNYLKTCLSNSNNFKWYKYNCGGKACKWYGNHTNIVLWENDGQQIKQEKSSVIRNSKNFFKEGISWKRIGSNFFRYLPNGFIFDQAGDSMFVNDCNNLYYILGLINSKVIRNCLVAISPTNNLTAGTMNQLPIIIKEDNNIKTIVKQNISISKIDWDSFETSWDFKKHPLLKFGVSINSGAGNSSEATPLVIGTKEINLLYEKNTPINIRIENAFEMWRQYAEQQFNKLKANEEELNRLFIEIYGLQDEMIPDVDDKDVTIRKADEVREIKSLISYAVGCMFGRYSLDKEGLVFAGGEFNKDNYKIFEADDDAIIPILSEHYFSDDITERFKKFIKTAFGDEYYDENLEYIASVLGKKNNETADDTIRNYFLKDFYNDHVKMYQKRPIYWLFSSEKGNFNALVYLHRYNKDTVSLLLNNYLREYREKLTATIETNRHIETSNMPDRDKIKAQKDIENAKKIVTEVTDYERDILYPLATERKEIDLDDGVKVNYLKFGKALKNIGLKA